MSGRKIIVLISNDSDPVRYVTFIVALFKALNVVIVVVFDAHSAISQKRRDAISKVLRHYFALHPQITLMVRNNHPVDREALIRESNYTDLIVVQPNNKQTYFAEMSVPVIVVPECAKQVDEVIITYDGRESGFETIRQFCQLLGNLCLKTRVTLLEINHDSDRFLPEEEKLSVEYLKGHCKNLGIYKVSEESPQQLLQRINSGGNALIVSGTFDHKSESVREGGWLTNQLISENGLPGFFGAIRTH